MGDSPVPSRDYNFYVQENEDKNDFNIFVYTTIASKSINPNDALEFYL